MNSLYFIYSIFLIFIVGMSKATANKDYKGYGGGYGRRYGGGYGYGGYGRRYGGYGRGMW
jgi:hypothetical protein